MIERENKEWGVRLTCHPFHGLGMKRGMRIYAEVSKPKPKQSPEITIVFSSVPIQDPLRTADAQTWGQALAAVLAEARNVADELKANRTKASKSSRSSTRRRTKRTKSSRGGEGFLANVRRVPSRLRRDPGSRDS